MILSCVSAYAKSIALTTGVEGNFTDETFCEYVRQNFDSNNDGELSDRKLRVYRVLMFTAWIFHH